MTQAEHTGGQGRAGAWRQPGRAMTVTLSVLFAIQLIGMFGALITAVVRTGDYGAFLAPGLDRLGDPKGWLPPIGPPEVWNPLLWIAGLPYSIVAVIRPFPVVGLLAAVVSLMLAGGRSVRSILWVAAFTALLALTFSPYGDVLHLWLID